MKIKILLVGGFLGAGKTSLLWEAASRLTARGMKVALITNDQASELVDSAFLLQTGLTVAEVSGSCFCCNFHGFADSIAKARAEVPDVILAGPPCTDLPVRGNRIASPAGPFRRQGPSLRYSKVWPMTNYK